MKSNTTLTQANAQWEARPADERFGSLAAMLDKAKYHRDNAAQAIVPLRDLRVETVGRDLAIVGPSNTPALLNNWSFGQMAARAGAPAGYLSTLPTELAAENLNTSLARRIANSDEDPKVNLLFGRNGNLTARAVTSEDYSRIWNADVIERLGALEQAGPWQPAPAAFDGSRGLYLGDRDMFAFMVDNERRIFETGPGGGLSRGFFCWNGEVGDRSIGVMTFFYEFVCGNHRVWGASGMKELRVAHIHTSDAKAWNKLAITLKHYAEASAEEDEAKVQAARTYEIGADKEAVLDVIFGKRIPGLTKSFLSTAFDKAEERVDWYGNPRSAWGLAGGITEIARDLPNADDRNALDKAATKIMELAF